MGERGLSCVSVALAAEGIVPELATAAVRIVIAPEAGLHALDALAGLAPPCPRPEEKGGDEDEEDEDHDGWRGGVWNPDGSGAAAAARGVLAAAAGVLIGLGPAGEAGVDGAGAFAVVTAGIAGARWRAGIGRGGGDEGLGLGGAVRIREHPALRGAVPFSAEGFDLFLHGEGVSDNEVHFLGWVWVKRCLESRRGGSGSGPPGGGRVPGGPHPDLHEERGWPRARRAIRGR